MVELSRGGRSARGKARNDRRTCECATARAELRFAAAHAPPQLDGDDRRADQPNKGAVRGCLCVESWTGADGFLSLYDLYHSIFYIDYLSLKMTSIKSLNGLPESYNFHINFTTIRVHAKSQFFFWKWTDPYRRITRRLQALGTVHKRGVVWRLSQTLYYVAVMVWFCDIWDGTYFFWKIEEKIKIIHDRASMRCVG
jgi:hypothetical protein